MSRPAYAHDNPVPLTCATLFKYIESRLPRRGFTTSYIAAAVHSDRTAFLDRSLRDAHGDTYWVLRNPGTEWGSSYSTNGFDPQGDTRWFLEFIGNDVGHVWGFYWDGGSLLQVPSPATWRKRLVSISDALEARGQERIAVGYHANLHFDPATRKSGVSKYIGLFVAHGQIPMAERSVPFLHDLSFHTGAVVLEKRFVDIARRRVEYFFAASNYLGQRARSVREAGDLRQAMALEKLQKSLRDRSVVMIDTGTGLINPLLADIQLREVVFENGVERLADVDRLSANVYGHLLGNFGKAPVQDLRSALINAQKDLEGLDGVMNTENVFLLVRDFDRDFKSSFEDFDSARPLEVTIEEFCAAMNHRRRVLREVSEDLARLGPRSPLELEIASQRPRPRRRLLSPRTWLPGLFFKP